MRAAVPRPCRTSPASLWLAALACACGTFHPVARTLATGTPASALTTLLVTALYDGGDANEASSDQAGDLWIATNNGVSCVLPDGGTLAFTAEANGLTTDQVRTVAGGDRGQALVGFGPQGVPGQDNPAQLNYLTLGGSAGVTVEAYHFNLTSEIVQANHAVFDPARHQFWIGTNEGVSLFDAARDVIEHRHPVHPHAFSNGVALTPDGNVWDGDGYQLSRLNAGPSGGDFEATFNPVLKPFALQQQNFAALDLDAQGRVWAASLTQGLTLVDPSAYTAEIWTLAAGLPSLQVAAVAVDPDGSVWVGTADQGLARLDPSSHTWTRVQPTVLAASAVRALFIDRSVSPRRLLIVTGAGVSAYQGS